MIEQAMITKSVIDCALRFPHLSGMLTHDEIREELIRQLDAEKLLAVDVARALHIAPARVTEMKRRKRRVQQDEMPKLAEMLGMIEPQSSALRLIESSRGIPNYGKVAQGVWLEESFGEPDPADREHVPYDRSAGDPSPIDLFAVTPEGTSMNEAWKPGTRLICQRIPFGAGNLKSGDYAIIERSAHDLHEMTAKRVEFDANGDCWLHSESDDPKFQEPWFIGKPDEGYYADTQIRVIAKVIRAVQIYG